MFGFAIILMKLTVEIPISFCCYWMLKWQTNPFISQPNGQGLRSGPDFELRLEMSMENLLTHEESRVIAAVASLLLAIAGNPFPASSARTASMVALGASRWVCAEISVITIATLPMD